MKRIYVVRHCASTGQEPSAPLTAQGRDQALMLADFLEGRKIETIVSSPYRRAVESVEPLAERLNIGVKVDVRLKERVLSSAPLNDWLECLQQTFTDFDLVFEGGESTRQAMNRAIPAVDEVLSGSPSNIVIVTHGNLMTLLLRYFDEQFGFEAWASLTNPDVYLVTMDGSSSSVRRIWD